MGRREGAGARQLEPGGSMTDLQADSHLVDWEQPADLYWDPFARDPGTDVYAVWRRMREEAPLYYNERHEFYALSRYEDVRSTYVDWKNYSSAQGDIYEIIHGGMTEFTVNNMISEDPPLQHLHRSTVNRAFTPKAVKIIEDRVRRFAISAIDEAKAAGEFDMIRDVGGRVAGSAIGGMLGVPDDELPMVLALTDSLLDGFEPGDGHDTTGWKEASNRQGEYYLGLLNERRANPTDDILSGLATLVFKDEHGVERALTDAEVLGNVMLLTGGGYETMARYTGWVGATLAQFPDQRAKLVERPELIPNAVEELLRFQPPSHANARVSTEDVEWYGRTVPAGSTFLLIPAAAGRDERQYPDPDVFDVEREVERHLAFGFGTHYCLGAPLAKMEGRIVLEEILKVVPEWDVDWDGAEFIHAGSAVRGFAKLPVTF